MLGIFEDLLYAGRVLRRTPALTAVAVLTLALGIAATTTVFGWIDGLVLHPFRGAKDDGQLAVLESVRASGIEDPNVSYADCRDFQDSLPSISGLMLNQQAPASIGDGENAGSAWFELVSGNYFDVLGVKPVLGRTFARDEYGDRAKAFTAVISYRLWQSYFRGNPLILGYTIRINRFPVTIVGVTPPEFHGDFPGVARTAGFQRRWPANASAMRGTLGPSSGSNQASASPRRMPKRRRLPRGLPAPFRRPTRGSAPGSYRFGGRSRGCQAFWHRPWPSSVRPADSCC